MSANEASPEPRVKRRGPGRPEGNQVVADRAQLLAAAARAINTRGPGVTLDDIAAEGGVSKPTLYRTLGDRAALVDALSELLIDAINATIRTAASTATSPRDAFEASVRGHLSAVDANRNLYLFVNGGDRSTAQLERLVDRSASQILELFSNARAAAGLDPSPARTWSYAVAGAFQTVTMMWLESDYCERDVVARDLTHLLWPAVVAAGDPF